MRKISVLLFIVAIASGFNQCLYLPAYTTDPQSFVDQRDGQRYHYRTYRNGLNWMTENLNYPSEGSACFGEEEEKCAEYGRLYTFDVARKACPEGWRLPTAPEWQELRQLVRTKNAADWISESGWRGEKYAEANNRTGLNIKAGGRGDDHGHYGSEPGVYHEEGISSSFWLQDDEYHWHVRKGRSHIHKHGPIAEQGRHFYIRCVCEAEE